MHGTYYAALDGLRAVAVVIVLMAHAGAPYPISGGVGVDIFFVLSGFLITSILANEYADTSRIILKSFYMRRCLRLMPCLFAVCCVHAFTETMRSGQAPLSTLAIVLTYTGNWARGLFGVSLGSLNHTWSLAIEEQFYLLWPLAVLSIEGYTPSNGKKASILFGAAIMLAIYRALMVDVYSADRIYFGLDTHMDGLVIGAGLCYAIKIVDEHGGLDHWGSRLLSHVATPVAIAGLLVVMGNLGRWNPLMGIVGYFLVAGASAAIIADLIVNKDSILSRVLSLPPVVYIGKISYGLYLWH